MYDSDTIPGYLQHEANAVACAPKLNDMLNSAAVSAMRELPPFRNNISTLEGGGMMAPTLVSGAGHDAIAMSLLTQVGILSLTCTLTMFEYSSRDEKIKNS